MKLPHRLLTGLAAALAGVALTGCDRETSPPPSSTDKSVNTPTNDKGRPNAVARDGFDGDPVNGHPDGCPACGRG